MWYANYIEMRTCNIAERFACACDDGFPFDHIIGIHLWRIHSNILRNALHFRLLFCGGAYVANANHMQSSGSPASWHSTTPTVMIHSHTPCNIWWRFMEMTITGLNVRQLVKCIQADGIDWNGDNTHEYWKAKWTRHTQHFYRPNKTVICVQLWTTIWII